MALIVKILPSYVNDSQYALEIFCDLNFHGENKLLTMVNTSLSRGSPIGFSVSGIELN